MKEDSLRQSNKGFTLVEIVVTLVLFSIIATITTMGLISWQEYSTDMSMNENAELIYMAARNKIAQLRANDVLQEMEGWGPNVKHTPYKVTSSGDKYYAVCSNEDHKKYTSKDKNVSDSVSESAKLLFRLVSDYLYDDNMLDAYIAIEYTEDGNICAAFYSDRTSLGYGSGALDLSVDSNRTESKLYDACVGSYSPN